MFISFPGSSLSDASSMLSSKAGTAKAGTAKAGSRPHSVSTSEISTNWWNLHHLTISALEFPGHLTPNSEIPNLFLTFWNNASGVSF